MEEILRVKNLCASYTSGTQRHRVLDNVSFSVNRGDFIAIVGPSGSGKSTLFYVLGCLLDFDSGEFLFEGTNVKTLSKSERARLRNARIGFVFQQFHLLPRGSVLNNILLPMQYSGESETARRAAEQRARELANRLGIGELLDRQPNQLSGGQQQRVAIARALIRSVDIILADEPTGNLDSKSSDETLKLLQELNDQGKTIIVITHDTSVADRCKKVWTIKDGKLFKDEPATPALPAAARNLTTTSPPLFSKDVFRLAAEGITRNKARAFLTMIGVIVGIASVFSMLTFGKFVKTKLLESYQDLGVNTLSVGGHRNWRLTALDKIELPFESFDVERDIKILPRIFPEIESYSPVLRSWRKSGTFGGLIIENDVRLMGVAPSYVDITKRELESGRNLNRFHVENGDAVCLIGAEIREKLFPATDPLGKVLFLTDDVVPAFSCRVIGVLKPQSTNKDWSSPNMEVLMPYTYFASVNSIWESRVYQFLLQLRDGTDIERTSRGVKNFYATKYGKAGEFRIGKDALLMNQMQKFLTLFSLLLAMIALVTLLVGGMGINNMMLVSINERLKEIGLRKALGATEKMIRLQHLLESSLLSAVAGIVGIIIGFSAYQLMIYLASRFMQKIPFEWVIDPVALSLSLICTVAVGVASGIVPALKAERLQVIQALRSE